MLTLSELQKLREVKTGDVPKEDLADIQTVEIDTARPIEERMEAFLKQIKNPYYFRSGEVGVRLSFTDNGKLLSEKLTQHFIRKKRNDE